MSLEALPFARAGCIGAKMHHPVPLITEEHHVFPLFLQARVFPDVDPDRPSTAHDRTRVNLCGNCHATVHVVIGAIMAGHGDLPKCPRILRKLARQAVDMFQNAQAHA